MRTTMMRTVPSEVAPKNCPVFGGHLKGPITITGRASVGQNGYVVVNGTIIDGAGSRTLGGAAQSVFRPIINDFNRMGFNGVVINGQRITGANPRADFSLTINFPRAPIN